MKDNDIHYFLKKTSLPDKTRQLAGPRPVRYRTDVLCGKYTLAVGSTDNFRYTEIPEDVTCERCLDKLCDEG